jgi:hypothetical protein
MIDPIQTGMLGVQITALVGLFWYCVETRRMRKAAQDQVRISQNLIVAAMDQVEGLSKPCLTMDSNLRDAADAIMSIGVVGNTVAAEDKGSFAVRNIGNGVALNVNFNIIYTGQYPANFPKPQLRYLQNVLAGQRVNMLAPMNPYNGGEFEVVFHYQSIGGRCYESRIIMNAFVLTEFRFGTLIPEDPTCLA